MNLRATNRELQQAQRISRALGTVVLLMGLAAMATYFLWPRGGARGVVVELSYMMANVFFSASAVALILSRVTFEEADLSAKAAIESSIEAALSPVRDALLNDCQSDYRWQCLLGLAPDGDALPEHAVQVISIEKTLPNLPSELRFVCVASYDDAALAPYAGDARYQFRWVVDEELDPLNPAVFEVLSVNVRALSGRALPNKDGLRLRHLAYAIPRELRGLAQCRVEFAVSLRKHVGADSRILIRTQLFKTTFGADFRCIVSEGLSLSGSAISSSEVSALGPISSPVGTVVARPGVPADLHIRYSSPLQAGSTVGFHLTRSTSPMKRAAVEGPA